MYFLQCCSGIVYCIYIQIEKKLMTDLQSDQIDQHLMLKLQQIVPELRKQIKSTIRARHQLNLQRQKQNKRSQLNAVYQHNIKTKIAERNQALKDSLANLVQMIQGYKSNTHKGKPRTLTAQQEQQFVQQTIEEIISNEDMLSEVKNRLRPAIQAKIKSALEKELEDGIQSVKEELGEKVRRERKEWMQERTNFWKRQSELQLKELQSEHQQLDGKKSNIEGTLNRKKMQKAELQERLCQINDKNMVISQLKRELNELKQNIRY